MATTLGFLEPATYLPDIEIVERKGIGHPDTICDALAERFSADLSRFYLERFGKILHHNVDKALLRGGVARAVFGGGEVLEPIDIYLAGRAVTSAGGVTIPVEDIAVEGVRGWIRDHLHALDPERHVRVHCLVRPGSANLADLLAGRGSAGIALANDTSFGVGYAPLSELERITLELEQELDARTFTSRYPAHGEDVKIMAVRHAKEVTLTVARAFVSEHVPSLDAYLGEKRVVADYVAGLAKSLGGRVEVHVNAADAPDGSSIYLTVTGTSAESGDDGEVGRGNRANGLITPLRPMSLEALAGKNAVSHVGKLYNVVARAIAEDILADVAGVRYAECYLVSRIGAPVDEPAVSHVRLGTDGAPVSAFARAVESIVQRHLDGVPNVWRRVLDGTIQLF